jgi:2-phospho-L-lactate transferase/gluconeogenesis factor (CofD/UPF0052 family)
MTQEGETENHSASDHIEAIETPCGTMSFGHVIVHDGSTDTQVFENSQKENFFTLKTDDRDIRPKGYNLIKADVVDVKDIVRHNNEKLAQVINRIIMDYDAKNLDPQKRVRNTE